MLAGTFEISWLRPIAHQYSRPATERFRKAAIPEFPAMDEENTKKQRSTQSKTKEIRLESVIAEHDMGVKAKYIDRILSDGDRVLVTIRFKGRAIKNIETGKDKIARLLEFIESDYSVIKPCTVDDNKVTITIGPKK